MLCEYELLSQPRKLNSCSYHSNTNSNKEKDAETSSLRPSTEPCSELISSTTSLCEGLSGCHGNKSSNKCQFCLKVFKSVGKHLPHCTLRNGEDHENYLSLRTRSSRIKKSGGKNCKSAHIVLKPSSGYRHSSETQC